MKNYELEYYPLDGGGKRIGEPQLTFLDAQNEIQARKTLLRDFEDLREIYEGRYPGVVSLQIYNVKEMKLSGIEKGIGDWLRKGRELDDFRDSQMSDEEREKKLLDFISDNREE